MLFNQLLDMPHLSGGWSILAKGEMHLREISFFVRMENVCDLFFQLMKHGTNTLHVLYFCSVYIDSTKPGLGSTPLVKFIINFLHHGMEFGPLAVNTTNH